MQKHCATFFSAYICVVSIRSVFIHSWPVRESCLRNRYTHSSCARRAQYYTLMKSFSCLHNFVIILYLSQTHWRLLSSIVCLCLYTTAKSTIRDKINVLQVRFVFRFQDTAHTNAIIIIACFPLPFTIVLSLAWVLIINVLAHNFVKKVAVQTNINYQSIYSQFKRTCGIRNYGEWLFSRF